MSLVYLCLTIRAVIGAGGSQGGCREKDSGPSVEGPCRCEGGPLPQEDPAHGGDGVMWIFATSLFGLSHVTMARSPPSGNVFFPDLRSSLSPQGDPHHSAPN